MSTPSSRAAKRPPRRRSAADTREALLAAAAEVFNTDGYFQTDTNRLARAAGYAPATFYKHFPNKREIFLATYERWVLSEWADIRNTASGGGSRDTVISAIVREVVQYHKRWRGFRRSLRALAATDDAVRAFQRRQRKAQMGFLPDLRSAAGLAPLSPGESLALLLAFERICDAIADGTPQALGVPEGELIAVLERLVTESGHA